MAGLEQRTVALELEEQSYPILVIGSAQELTVLCKDRSPSTTGEACRGVIHPANLPDSELGIENSGATPRVSYGPYPPLSEIADDLWAMMQHKIQRHAQRASNPQEKLVRDIDQQKPKSLVECLTDDLKRCLYSEHQDERTLTWDRLRYNGHLQSLLQMCGAVEKSTFREDSLTTEGGSDSEFLEGANDWRFIGSIATARLTRFLADLRELGDYRRRFGEQASSPEKPPVLPPATLHAECDLVLNNPLTWTELFTVCWFGLRCINDPLANIEPEAFDDHIRLLIRRSSGANGSQVASQEDIHTLAERIREMLADRAGLLKDFSLTEDKSLVIDIAAAVTATEAV